MHTQRPVFRLLSALTLSLAAALPSVHATDVTLSPLFGDHSVLQRDKPLPVWGTAGPGDSVLVTFHGQSAKAVAGADGKRLAQLGPFPASTQAADLVVSSSNTVVVHDVLVGDVWLCGGQSNMEFKVDDGGFTYHVNNSREELAAASYPMIRQIEIQRAVSTAPVSVPVTKGWKVASPDTVGVFTAVGYFFARDIHRATGVPIGIILSCWGGTAVESWMDDAARASTSLAATLDTRWTREKAAWPPERVARYPADMEAWNKAEANATATHTKNPLHWPQPPATDSSPARPGGLFNAMIAPLEPTALRGILWYQGEANVGHADEYAELFSTMIRSWRQGFGQGDVPFYFVQLANFGNPYEFGDRGWARLRDAQTQTLALPATGMAVTIDIGNADNIHPRNKQEVGRRLALIAKANVYGVAPEVTGPIFAGATVEGSKMRVHFTHSGTELESRAGLPAPLEIAGADRVFHPAFAEIDVDTLLVSSPDVAAPTAVRYAWTNAPSPNLYSDDGLPVVPFRSDSW
ncbi:MAG TPA: sialate O-acetylesterase [Opitutaceae bacterium]|nr:sialate O-acetylesterase [Opitutaceae bacterium]